VKAGILHFI